MKFRGLVIAVLVLAALAGGLYWSEHHKSREAAGPAAASAPQILGVKQADVTGLTLKRPNAEPIILVRDADGHWQITEPTQLGADPDTLSSMLFTLSSLDSTRVVEDKAADLKQYGLDPPVLEVDIAKRNGKTQRLLLGDNTPTGGEVYAMLAGDPRVFTTSISNKAGVDEKLNDLRNKQLIKANSDKITRIELIRNGQDMEFERNKTGWQITKPRPLRAYSLLLDDLARTLAGARMDLSGTGNNDVAAEFARAKPVATVRITDDLGTQVLQIRGGKDGYYAKSSIVKGVYKTDAYLAQSVDKDLDNFRNKNIFDFSSNDPNKVDVQTGSTTYVFVRDGQDWLSNGKKMNADDTESLVSQLRDLSATKFLDSGFNHPTVDLTVTSENGKQVEKVLIAKSGNGWIAKRENESTLYQLDPTAVPNLEKAAETIKPAAIVGPKSK